MPTPIEDQIRRLELELLCFRIYTERNFGNDNQIAKGNQDPKENPAKLSINHKLEIATSLLGDIQHEASESKRLHQEKINVFNISLEEIELRLVDMEKDAFAFKREVVVKTKNKISCMSNYDRVLRYFQSRILSLESTLDKLRLQHSEQKSKMTKRVAQLKQRQSVGASIHFLDFHQLNIDTKAQLQELNRKTNELATAKLRESKIRKKLIAEEQKLKDLENTLLSLDKAIALREKHVEKLDQTLISLEHKFKIADTMAANVLVAKEKEDDSVSVMEMISRQELKNELKKEILIWERKVNISK